MYNRSKYSQDIFDKFNFKDKSFNPKIWHINPPNGNWVDIVRYNDKLVDNSVAQTKWRMVRFNDTVKKLYPKTILSSLICIFASIVMINTNKRNYEKYLKGYEKRSQGYHEGYKNAIKNITESKISGEKLKDYVDLIVFLDNQKTLKATEQQKQKFNKILNDALLSE